MANSADQDQFASSEASWSGSTLLAKAGYIRVQQDKGWLRLALGKLYAFIYKATAWLSCYAPTHQTPSKKRGRL